MINRDNIANISIYIGDILFVAYVLSKILYEFLI